MMRSGRASVATSKSLGLTPRRRSRTQPPTRYAWWPAARSLAITERAIGKAAPWFILAIMLFSYAVRAIYIESCSMFVRGGVYKVVHEAMGGTLAKFSVSALMFDYVLTGPISGVSAGLYLGGLINETAESFHLATVHLHPPYFPAAFAILMTLYFWRTNIIGIPESRPKAFRIMHATTLMSLI